jgi:hexokinase
MKSAKQFLEDHRLRASDIDMQGLVDIFINEMETGLGGKGGSLRMIPTYIEAENDFLTDVPVLAIDAGGTNFRTALISFDQKGTLVCGEIKNFRMPGLDREVSSREFFSIMADYVRPLAEKSERIGFCFSYPTEILPNRDGRLIQFCKEVQAPEVVGQLIGMNLLESLGTPGKHLVLLNDTVATLLAGKSASPGKQFDSFIGYILGTGTNTCYIERNRNIIKNRNLDSGKSQIINIESGNFAKAPRTDLDLLLDNSTMDPGNYSFEKMFSGGYFGGLCLTVLKAAGLEGVLSAGSAALLNNLSGLTSNDASDFARNDGSVDNPLKTLSSERIDSESARVIIDTLIDRAAKLVASNIAAVVLKTGRGKSPSKPVLITIDGTTFYKMFRLRERFEKYLGEFLSDGRARYVEFTEVQQSSLIGAALAALI